MDVRGIGAEAESGEGQAGVEDGGGGGDRRDGGFGAASSLNVSAPGSSQRRRDQVNPAEGDGISARTGATHANDYY